MNSRLSSPIHSNVAPAWAVVLLISTVPDIVWVELTGQAPHWLPFAKMALLAALCLAASFWSPLRPFRRLCVVMLAFLVLLQLRPRIDFEVPALQAALGDTAFDARMQAEQTGKLAVAMAMIGVLLLLGLSRRQFFLCRGDLRAPIGPVPWLGFPRAEPWYRFGLQWGFYIAGALAVVMYWGLRPSGAWMVKVLPMLPSIFFYAALNAFHEEFTYRAPMLATLEPVCGSRQALWISAGFFGVAHYFGTPGGIAGAIASIFMGWILGKGMLETRGAFWSWWIHFLADVAIFFFLALGLVQ